MQYSPKSIPFDQLVASVEDYAIFTMTPEGHILDWNVGAQRIKQYTAEEIVGAHFSRFYSESDRSARLPEMELEIAAAKGKFADEGWRFRKDGQRFWASVTITAIFVDNVLEGFLKITRDLTELMLAAEELRQSEERFRLLIENVEDYAIFMLDPGGHIMSWNRGARKIKGYEQEEILGRHFSIFYPSDSALLGLPTRLLEKAVAEGHAEHEGWRVRRDGTRFWGNAIVTALLDRHGELRGFAKITRDLTDRRKAEEAIEDSHRKDTFLATLAHELRNPLAPILPGLDVIQQAAEDPEKVRRVAAMIQRQVGQMKHLIDDLLDMSRISSGKISLQMGDVELAAVIQSAVESVEPALKAANHVLSVKLPPGRVVLHADEHRLSQVLSNLLSNAIRYTPPGGLIELRASVGLPGELHLAVRDNGQGIAPDRQELIFELFEQGSSGSSEGLGIGLTLVKKITELHSGRIAVLSEGEGKGSEFMLYLPVVARVEDDETPALSVTGAARPRRILIADDGVNAADILGMFFEMEGYDTRVVYDGLAAVGAAAEFQPDIVCLDLGMPLLDGFGAGRKIRAQHPGVLLIALSGWGAREDRVRTREAGFDLHLVKPVKPDELRAALKEFGK